LDHAPADDEVGSAACVATAKCASKIAWIRRLRLPQGYSPKKIASASFPNGSEAEKGNKADTQREWCCSSFKLFESFVPFGSETR
jgi:hypothetical protein